MNSIAPMHIASRAHSQSACSTQNSGRRSSSTSRTVPPPKAARPPTTQIPTASRRLRAASITPESAKAMVAAASATTCTWLSTHGALLGMIGPSTSAGLHRRHLSPRPADLAGDRAIHRLCRARDEAARLAGRSCLHTRGHGIRLMGVARSVRPGVDGRHRRAIVPAPGFGLARQAGRYAGIARGARGGGNAARAARVPPPPEPRAIVVVVESSVGWPLAVRRAWV
mmetsp:Transcript_5751/g.22258  ORF Transcript_5751/g.22258 Transcript_5751/m.22258 type:complete len:226 (-) Transcript_5751:3339-4016(-)